MGCAVEVGRKLVAISLFVRFRSLACFVIVMRNGVKSAAAAVSSSSTVQEGVTIEGRPCSRQGQADRPDLHTAVMMYQGGISFSVALSCDALTPAGINSDLPSSMLEAMKASMRQSVAVNERK